MTRTNRGALGLALAVLLGGLGCVTGLTLLAGPTVGLLGVVPAVLAVGLRGSTVFLAGQALVLLGASDALVTTPSGVTLAAGPPELAALVALEAGLVAIMLGGSPHPAPPTTVMYFGVAAVALGVLGGLALVVGGLGLAAGSVALAVALCSYLCHRLALLSVGQLGAEVEA